MQEVVVQTVTGLGYDLVELERSAGGLLRITIDHPWTVGTEPVFVTVEDCEKVTRQLQFVLEAEEVEYRRLEVSSPGIDRPLRHQADFERFAGEVVDLEGAHGSRRSGTGVSAAEKIPRHAGKSRCPRALADCLAR
jgi:ribosome maturation factor RimP